ncbi:MAG: zinc-binding dehydrogenase [Nitrosotalea sp.]
MQSCKSSKTGARIIAMDIDDEKLQVAKQNGVDFTINSKNQDVLKFIMELTDNLEADAVIDFVKPLWDKWFYRIF